MKKDRYYYPAVFGYDPNEEEISVVFPDLGCATSGTDDADTLSSARELLGCVLFGMEEDGEEIPQPSKLSDIETDETEKTVLIDVFMPAVRMAQSTKAVNRTVTLPAWLNAVAQENGINFSAVLQAALKKELHVANR